MNKQEFTKIMDTEFLKFERIPEADRLSSHPDLCGLIYLEKHFGPSVENYDILVGAEHDIVWVDCTIEELSHQDVTYLARCGFHYNSEYGSLAMFV